INRHTLLAYLQYLAEAKLIRSLYKDAHGVGALQKPDKLYLENTNLMYLFKGSHVDIGTVRETFLANQLSYLHELAFSEAGDFLVDGHYTIEVGGKNKTRKQIQTIADAFIAADNLEYGHERKIPLWMFGFLY
ncbi:MAG: AAA family ATPase, partial [Rectinemataceae bacterium]|nr:AAA family ATPase [Rectinemataceae bacterium]